MTHPHLRAAVALLSVLTAPVAAQSVTLGSFPALAQPAGDVNGDGIGDVILRDNASLSIADGPTGVVLPYLTQPNSGSTGYRGVGDYDGDGKDDLGYYQPGVSGAILSGNDGSTLLAFPAGNPSLLGIWGRADLDADGLYDLLLTRLDSTAQTHLTEIVSARTGATLFQASYPAASGPPFNEPSLAGLGDVNGDGYDDVGVWANGVLRTIVLGPGGTTVSVFLTSAASVGDIDADGTSDVLSSGFHAIYSGASLVTGPAQVIWQFLLSTLDSYAMGDIDGDGHADIASQSLFSVTGAFSGADHTQFPGAALASAAGVSLGDIDGDGRAEFAQGSTRVEWHDPALPISSRMLRRGVPGTTSSGRKPVIVTRGHCGLGHTAWFDIRGCEPNSIVAFAIGGAANVDLGFLGAPGNHAYTTAAGLSALLADGNGLAKLQVTMPTSPALLGATASVQAAVFDPPANGLGLVTSNAIDVETQN